MFSADLLNILIIFVDKAASFLVIAIFARILLSWARFGGLSVPTGVAEFVSFLTDPFFNFMRRFPLHIGMMDFSPFVLVMAIGVIRELLIKLLISLA